MILLATNKFFQPNKAILKTTNFDYIESKILIKERKLNK